MPNPKTPDNKGQTVYNYELLVKPLYAVIREGNGDLRWTKEAVRPFGQLRKVLVSA